MKEKISSCSISRILLLLCVVWISLPAGAQTTYGTTPSSNRSTAGKEKKKKKEKAPEVTYPLWNGLSVGIDLWGLGSKVFGGDFVSSEIAVDADLKHRYFPVVELGYGGTDTWNEKGIHYKSHAPYVRVGMDYNTLYGKAHGHQLRVGLRYAATRFKYDVLSLSVDDPAYGGGIDNPLITDGIWGGTIPFDHKGMEGSMQWAELCVGIRAHVWQHLYMGWAMRFKFKLSGSPDAYGDPWYVPGFGKYGSNTLGITYTLTYKLPW